MWHARPPPPFMANAILNFHFDFPHTSLNKDEYLCYHFCVAPCISSLRWKIVQEGVNFNFSKKIAGVLFFCILVSSPSRSNQSYIKGHKKLCSCHSLPVIDAEKKTNGKDWKKAAIENLGNQDYPHAVNQLKVKDRELQGN